MGFGSHRGSLSYSSQFICVFPKIGRFNPPKWMVKIMENHYFLMDDLGVALFLETPI